MKIGFDAKRAFLNSSGLGSYSRNTLYALNFYFPEYSYVLFTPEVNNILFKNYSSFKTVSPQKYIPVKIKSVWYNLFLKPHIIGNHLDIFHGLSNKLPRGIHRTGIHSVVTIHDLIFMRYPEFYNFIDKHIYFNKVKYACNVADKIIAVSQQTKNDIEAFLHIRPNKIEVIYQPVSSEFFQNQDTFAILNKYKIHKKFILSVGTLEKRKNQLTLLKALKAANIKIPVVFVGRQTSYVSEINHYIKKHKMEKQVIFLSNLPKKDLAGLYQGAFLSIYISIFEGFGLPVIESMAGGCPVITSNTSCMPETAGGAAVLCDPHDEIEIGKKIAFLLENSKNRKEIIQKGINRAKLFHPEIYAKNLISFYRNILTEDHAK
jgi:glycosyltransferase involved in cell wall biosynthesis